MGRPISPSDDQQDAPAVAVLNYDFWQREFGASPSAIGKTIRLNGVSFEIVGITESRFDALTLSNKYDLWVPMAHRPNMVPRWNAKQDKMNASWLIIIGRVKPGVSVSQAQAAVSLLFHNDMLQSDIKMFKPENDPAIRLVSAPRILGGTQKQVRSEEHTSELQSPCNLVCRLLLEK